MAAAPVPTPAETTGLASDPGAFQILVASLLVALTPVLILLGVDKDTVAIIGGAAVLVVAAISAFLRSISWRPGTVRDTVLANRAG